MHVCVDSSLHTAGRQSLAVQAKQAVKHSTFVLTLRPNAGQVCLAS